MNPNPEVMTAAAQNSQPRPPFVSESGRPGDQPRDGRVSPAAASRISEDPMRRTDRYRLVVPWSERV
jgi:hypothetical protein